MLYKIQFERDKSTQITWNLVRTNINAYHGLAFTYVMLYDQDKRPNLLFTKTQIKQAIKYFKSHNRKNVAEKIKSSVKRVNSND